MTIAISATADGIVMTTLIASPEPGPRNTASKPTR